MKKTLLVTFFSTALLVLVSAPLVSFADETPSSTGTPVLADNEPVISEDVAEPTDSEKPVVSEDEINTEATDLDKPADSEDEINTTEVTNSDIPIDSEDVPDIIEPTNLANSDEPSTPTEPVVTEKSTEITDNTSVKNEEAEQELKNTYTYTDTSSQSISFEEATDPTNPAFDSYFSNNKFVSNIIMTTNDFFTKENVGGSVYRYASLMEIEPGVWEITASGTLDIATSGDSIWNEIAFRNEGFRLVLEEVLAPIGYYKNPIIITLTGDNSVGSDSPIPMLSVNYFKNSQADGYYLDPEIGTTTGEEWDSTDGSIIIPHLPLDTFDDPETPVEPTEPSEPTEPTKPSKPVDTTPTNTDTGNIIVTVVDSKPINQLADGTTKKVEVKEIGANVQKGGTASANGSDRKMKDLPKTGETASMALSVLGALVLLGAGIIFKKRV